MSSAPSGAPIYVVGSVPVLGNWAPGSAVALTQSGSQWSGTVTLPASTAFQYKYISKDSSGNVTWEQDPNHSATTSTAAATLSDTWHGASSATPVKVTFDETKTTVFGQNVYVVGDIPALGAWNTANAVALSSATYPVWSGTVSIPPSTSFQYKYIVIDGAGNVTWESGANRSAASGTGAAVTLTDSWK